MKPIIIFAIIAMLVYLYTSWFPLQNKNGETPPGETITQEMNNEQNEQNDTPPESNHETINMPSPEIQYVNADENKEDKYENIDSSNSSYILQSGFQADQSAKSVYNGISNIEQNEMFAIKSVGNSKSRSITDDFNLKYLHTLNSKR